MKENINRKIRRKLEKEKGYRIRKVSCSCAGGGKDSEPAGTKNDRGMM